MSTVLPGFLTVKEAMKALGVSEQRVRQLISGDQLRNCRRVGAALIIPESEVARRKEAFPPRRRQKLSPVPVTNGNGHK